MGLPWDSKSATGAGSFEPPAPQVGESSGGGPSPTDISSYSGFGHEWTPPASEAGASSNSGQFPAGGSRPSAELPWVGGDSQSRNGSNSNTSE